MSRCYVSCVGTYHCNISSTYNVNIFWNFYNSVWGLPSLYQFSVRRLTSQVGPVYATRWIFYIEILLQCFFVCMLLRVMCLFIFQTSFQFFGFQRYFMIILTWLEGANSWSLIKYKLNVFTPLNSWRGSSFMFCIASSSYRTNGIFISQTLRYIFSCRCGGLDCTVGKYRVEVVISSRERQTKDFSFSEDIKRCQWWPPDFPVCRVHIMKWARKQKVTIWCWGSVGKCAGYSIRQLLWSGALIRSKYTRQPH